MRDFFFIMKMHLLEIWNAAFIWDDFYPTVEPGDGDGFQEADSDDGGAHSKLLQELHHVGSTLQRIGAVFQWVACSLIPFSPHSQHFVVHYLGKTPGREFGR